MENDTPNCPLCTGTGNGKFISLTEKGVKGIERAAEARNISCHVTVGTVVHDDCRKSFTNKKALTISLNESTSNLVSVSRKRQSAEESKHACLYCQNTVNLKNVGSSASCVKTDIFVDSVTEVCRLRSDEWAMEVQGRLEYYRYDLHAADIMYHRDCDTCFRTGRQLPATYHPEPAAKKARQAGRPTDARKQAAFTKVALFLKETGQASVSDLVQKMEDYLEASGSDKSAYSRVWMKEKLQEYFKDTIVISQQDGGEDIVTCIEDVDSIVRTAFTECRDGDEVTKAEAIIKAAAKLILSESLSMKSNMDSYPSLHDLDADAVLQSIPSMLKLFLESTLTSAASKEKIAFIGQAILQILKPRSILAPWNFGLGVSLYHLYRSRYLIDVLNFFGLSCSYREVLRFVRNSAATGAENPLGESSTGTVLFSGDNVDHNRITLNGRETFHGLGLMASVTPGGNFRTVVPRKKTDELNVDLMKTGIDLKQFSLINRLRSSVKFHPLPECEPAAENCVDIMWEVSFKFHSQAPSWNGMMFEVTTGRHHPGKSSFFFLPMIDMHSTDYSCLYSALRYIDNLSHKNSIEPVMTFDQPLFSKSYEILQSLDDTDSMRRIVLLLGSFHLFMNYLGAVGYLMSGLGLEELFEEIYAGNVVPHLISGKAVSRAFRAHLLLDNAIKSLFIEPLFDRPDFVSNVEEIENLYLDCCKGGLSFDDLISSPVLSAVQLEVDNHKNAIASHCRHNQMLLKYNEMIQYARDMIRAERSGDWALHLNTTRKMLVVIAASGHYNYTKATYVYLQTMSKLEETHPTVYDMLSRGRFVCRRTDRFWAGIGSDLSIEQVLMRGLKTSGGLTRGSGFSEMQRMLWTLSAPSLSAVHGVMSQVSGLSLSRSDQHKEMGVSRRKRDANDMELLREKLSSLAAVHVDCSEKSHCETLLNVVTGNQAPSEVDVDRYAEIGAKVLKQMEGQLVLECRLSRKDRAISAAIATRGVKLPGGRVIDSRLMFQRLVISAQAGDVSLQDALHYELAPYPPALFQSSTMTLRADKPALAQALVKHAGIDVTQHADPPNTDHYVIDGGSLLYKLKWQDNSRYLNIARSYAEYCSKRYFRPTVIFDGYKKRSIKDTTHTRRNPKAAPRVIGMETSVYRGKRETVLSNLENKDQLINLIMPSLHDANCPTYQSTDDADVDLVLAATQSCLTRSTTLIGEDTDLLILALHHYNIEANSEPLFFRSDKRTSKKIYNIPELGRSLGPEITQGLLFLHAFSGCDTTSRVAGLSKQAALQKLASSHQLQSVAKKFSLPGQTQDTIESQGIDAMKLFLGLPLDQSLSATREKKLTSKILRASAYVAPDKLPPTDSATEFHSWRVYYQVMTWMQKEEEMNPLEWGWRLVEKSYLPVTMDEEPAPPNLLKIVHCECKTGCSTARCSCRKLGQPCHNGCGNCQVDFCSNCAQPEFDEEDDAGERI